MMDDLSHDRYGIAWAGLTHAEGKPEVKPLAISISPGGAFIECNEDTVRNRTYPLTRSIFIQLNRPPGTPIPPKIKEFLLYVWSREGQQAVSAQGEYLPLTPAEWFGKENGWNESHVLKNFLSCSIKNRLICADETFAGS